MKKWLFTFACISVFTGCSPSYTGVAPVIGPKDSAESRVGERLFREPRFSEFFVRHSNGDINAALNGGDPVLLKMRGQRRGELNGPFSNQAMSCVACHMVDDAQFVQRGGMRGYTDFVPRSPIPHLPTDSLSSTPRNAPTLLEAFVNRPDGLPFLLHYDGEFASTEDLVIGSLTGRNFGWRADQGKEALANIVRVIREDNGQNDLAMRFGKVSYRELIQGESPNISKDTVLAPENRRNVVTASDEEIIGMVKTYMTMYLNALQLSRDPQTNLHNGSPYDKFLVKNQLPQEPDAGETTSDYADRLSKLVQGLGKPEFIKGDSGSFGKQELNGLKIFLARSKQGDAKNAGFPRVGNCVACHTPPEFTDYKFHNTGETQDEYDSVHGAGKFAAITIPSFAERMADPDAYQTATASHPNATGKFRSIPDLARPGYTDLGAWNILLNPDYPAPQSGLEQLFCENGKCASAESKEAALSSAVATFKTSTLRLLSLSDPYLHTGRKQTIEDVLRFYQKTSELQRQGRLRNGAKELAQIQLDDTGVADLAAFLRSLDEDYE